MQKTTTHSYQSRNELKAVSIPQENFCRKVRGGKVKCEEDKGKKNILLSNGVVSRGFCYKSGFRTSLLTFKPDGRNLVDPRHKFGLHGERIEETSPSREVMIGINGTDYNIGLGEGFSFVECGTECGKDNNLILTAVLKNQGGLELALCFEMYESEPFIIKWVELKNNSGEAVTISSCQPEVLTLPACGSHRWHECTRKVYPTGHVAYPTKRPFTFWTEDYSPAENQPMIWIDHFTTRAEEFGFAMVNNYVRRAFVEGFETIGHEICPPKLPGMICSCGHRKPGEVFTQFPVGPNVVLKPGDKFVSFKTYTVFFQGGYEDGGLALRRMIKRVCPWTRDFHTRFEHTYWTKSMSEKIRNTGNFDMSDLKYTIDQAAELGFDYWYFTATLWAQSFGEYRPRPEFPNGWEDMRKVSDYIHSKGLKVGVHAAEDYGVDFQDHYLVDDETGKVHAYDIGAAGDFIQKHPYYRLLDEDGNHARGWVMCGASGFHEHLLKRKIDFAKNINCDLLDNDGPYYGDLCYAKNHGHSSPEEAQYKNWHLAVERYRAYREAGCQVIAPDGTQSLFNGNAANPTYHTETSTRFDPYDFVRDIRTCLYKSSFYMPATAMYYSVWCDPAVMNNFDVTMDEQLFDYYFASIAVYGVNVGMLGLHVYNNDMVRNTIKKWIGFMKDYHEILCGDIIHLAEPNLRDIDGIIHIAPHKVECGLFAGFNSTRHVLKKEFVVPGKYLGAKRIILKDIVHKEFIGDCKCDAEEFVFEVEIPAKSYKLILMRKDR